MSNHDVPDGESTSHTPNPGTLEGRAGVDLDVFAETLYGVKRADGMSDEELRQKCRDAFGQVTLGGEVASWQDIVVKVDGNNVLDADALKALNYAADDAERVSRMFKPVTTTVQGTMTLDREVAGKLVAIGEELVEGSPDVIVVQREGDGGTVLDPTQGTFNNLPDAEPLTRAVLEESMKKIDELTKTRIGKPERTSIFDPWRPRPWYGGGHYMQPQIQQHAVEQSFPEPVQGTLEGKAELKPFHFEVQSYSFSDYDEFGGYYHGKKVLRITAVVESRDYGGRNPITFSGTFERDRPEALCIRELLLRALRHELEECIHVNGVRIWDPHLWRSMGF